MITPSIYQQAARKWAEKAKSSELKTQLVDVHKLNKDSHMIIGNLLAEITAREDTILEQLSDIMQLQDVAPLQ